MGCLKAKGKKSHDKKKQIKPRQKKQIKIINKREKLMKITADKKKTKMRRGLW